VTDSLPAVSVIVPVYERAGDLGVVLSGIARQRQANVIEVFVVDDASSDPAVASTALRWGASLIRMPRRRGAAVCKNAALARARGEYVQFLDSDVELVDRTTIRAMTDVLRSTPGCGEIGGEAILDRHGARAFFFGRQIDLRNGSSHCEYLHAGAAMREVAYVPTSNCMVRAEVARRVGGFDPVPPGFGHDKDFGMRVASLGLRNYTSEGCTVHHRFSPSFREGDALFRQYATQIRFLARHRGTARAIIAVAAELWRKLAGRDPERSPAAPPEIAAFEARYRTEILGLSAEISALRRRLGCASLWTSAALWNVSRRRTRPPA
jgi:O-antigen biosynthesis protein